MAPLHCSDSNRTRCFLGGVPVAGSTKVTEWLTVLCMDTLDREVGNLIVRCPLVWMYLCTRRYVGTWAWIIGRRVAASRWWTTSIYPKAGLWEVTANPNTHTSVDVDLPLWFWYDKHTLMLYIVQVDYLRFVTEEWFIYLHHSAMEAHPRSWGYSEVQWCILLSATGKYQLLPYRLSLCVKHRIFSCPQVNY